MFKFLEKIKPLSWFFKDGISKVYSMGRLLSFLVVCTICFDAIWSLVVLKLSWAFTTEKMLFGVTALSVKAGSLLIEKRFGLTKDETETETKKEADDTKTSDNS